MRRGNARCGSLENIANPVTSLSARDGCPRTVRSVQSVARPAARHQRAGWAGTDATRSVGDEDMQDLGAPNPVEDLHAKAILEPLVEGLRQRFPGRHRLPDARQIEVGALPLVYQELPVIGRNGKEKRRLLSLALPL